MLTKKLSIALLLFLCFGIISYYTINNHIPKEAPVPIVEYNNKLIPTTESMYNWFDKGKGGNSHLALPPEENTKDLEAIAVEQNRDIMIKFDTKYQPQQIEIIHWTQGRIKSSLILNGMTFKTATVPGIYVYEVIGKWDETHQSAHSFGIEVK
ncbi:hypothetical protein [Desulfosporosinus youngiae]|uniref:Uncharacterized protein n=1 Tax=Desulfosporosinus youngiae DSM 17734 TaxID=768710 RepID=H5Y364_9FIRM|nr:hypothetical protein [Desulfosporosinus youngiae]EHQ88759.1 hypothetical protein DesyoDRAFT_1630 [Desulfosporosinus youngiae DSM 17734]